MSAWFRSAEMTFVSLIINEDAAHFTIKSLGELGVVQFTDVSAAFFRAFHRQRLTCAHVVSQLNSEQTAFQRRYISYVKRCDELERKLRFFTSELAPHAITAEVLEMFAFFSMHSTPCLTGRATGTTRKFFVALGYAEWQANSGGLGGAFVLHSCVDGILCWLRVALTLPVFSLYHTDRDDRKRERAFAAVSVPAEFNTRNE